MGVDLSIIMSAAAIAITFKLIDWHVSDGGFKATIWYLLWHSSLLVLNTILAIYFRKSS